MIPISMPEEGQKWFIWFFLKVNLVLLGLFLFIEGIIGQLLIIIGIGLILLFVGGLLVYRDIRSDPYLVLRLMRIQFVLWWRIQGPFISRQPYLYHFPEGRHLQQQHIFRILSIKNKDLLEGTSLVTRVRTVQLCPDCGGKRNQPMTVQIECSRCQNGRQIYSLQGNITIPVPCNHCLGIGWVPIHSCSTCQGKGSVWTKQRIRVHVPPNTTSGTKFRIPSLGKIDSKTLQQGDLFLKVRKKILNLF